MPGFLLSVPPTENKKYFALVNGRYRETHTKGLVANLAAQAASRSEIKTLRIKRRWIHVEVNAGLSVKEITARLLR